MTPLNQFLFRLFTLFLVLGSNLSFGQTQLANLDQFNSDLYFKFGNGSGINRVYKVLELANGQILVGGTFYEVNGFKINGIARLNADGSFDHTFHSGMSEEHEVTALAELPSGKILVGGSFNSYDGLNCGNFVVLNPNGTRDMTYTGGGNVGYSRINDIQLTPDNKVIIAGYFTSFNGVLRNGLARLTSSLQVDTSFGTTYSGNSGGDFKSVLVFPDGGVLVGGDFINYWGNGANGLIKLTAAGNPDPNFNLYTPAGFNANVTKVKFASDGKIFICGHFTGYGGLETYDIVRLNSNGSVDNTFQNNLWMPSGAIQDCIDFNGHVIIVGGLDFDNEPTVNNMAYLDNNGVLLVGESEILNCEVDDPINLIEKLSDGSFVIGGTFYRTLGRVSRSLVKFTDINIIKKNFFTPPASHDYTANNFLGNGSVQSIGKYSNSHYLVSGRFSEFNGNKINGLVRLNSNGEVDMTFNAHFPAGVVINAFAVQPDGKVLVNYQNNNQDYNPKLIRLNTNGGLDYSFSCPLHYVVTRILWSNSNTRIIIAGYDQSSPDKAVNKLNLDGTLDPAFNPYSSGDMLDIIELSNGKILVEERWGGITKISATGVSDPSFNGSFSPFSTPATGFALQSDGKIIFSGPGGNRIYRLNANGTADATYQSEYNVSADYHEPTAIELQSDDKLIVYGNGKVYRFNVDGSLDSSFKEIVIKGGRVNDFILDSTHLLIGGDYTHINDFPINDMVGIDYSNNNTVGLDELSNPIADNALRIYPNPIGLGQKLSWDTEEQIESTAIYSMEGRLIQEIVISSGEKSVDLNLEEGTYIVHGKTESGKYKVGKLMVCF